MTEIANAIGGACSGIQPGYAGSLSSRKLARHIGGAVHGLGHDGFNIHAEGRLRNDKGNMLRQDVVSKVLRVTLNEGRTTV